jgi:uncharacterized ubiquitin-like protein YukD
MFLNMTVNYRNWILTVIYLGLPHLTQTKSKEISANAWLSDQRAYIL